MSELFYKAAGAILAPFRYAEREVHSLKEEVREDLHAFVANLIKVMLITIASVLFLLFMSIMAALAINDSANNKFLGWAIMAGFYLLVAISLYIWKETAENDKKKTGILTKRSVTKN